MTKPSFLEQTLGHSLDEFTRLSPEQRAAPVRRAIPDLNHFFDRGVPFEERPAPARTRELARSLFDALGRVAEADGARTLASRIVTDSFLRTEADRDQNVYLGPLFTRRLTRAVPDLVFQPIGAAECAATLRWARERGVAVTLRGAASTAMGGSVPNDGGLTLDLSRLDGVDVDPAAGVCVVGAGARLRAIHEVLARHGMALQTYPSNLGGTLVGWFVTGGIGLNAFRHGRAIDGVRAADVLLPAGDHVRFHDDGRMDVPEGGSRRTLAAAESAAWFRARGYEPLGLRDLAGSEGTLGLVLGLTVSIEKRPEIGAFLLSFRGLADSLTAAAWVGREAGTRFGAPANVKLFSGSHMHHVRRVWQDEDARGWRDRPSALSSDACLPWTRVAGPAELGAGPGVGGARDGDRAAGAAPAASQAAGRRDGDGSGGHAARNDGDPGAAYLFVDFLGLDEARAFAGALSACPGAPRVLEAESVRVAVERFRPQQTKRLGPGLLAAEILMPAAEVPAFLPRARALAGRAGAQLDAEVYYLADGTALVIAGYLADHRSGALALDLALAPALLDLAMRAHRGQPYVLGRWQSPYFGRRFGAAGARLRTVKRGLDPVWLLNRGVLFGLRLHGALGAVVRASFVPGVRLLRMALGWPGAGWVARAARRWLARLPGPASGRGEPAAVGAVFRASRPGAEPGVGGGLRGGDTPQAAAARALHCVNCGECNTVCPIFHESKVRLPQMLTHIGEAVFAGETVPETGSTLLDLCMRCGNCEEVCQAGIPHLPLYEVMQRASDRARPRDRERHVAVLAAVRASERYLRGFLDVRAGGYVRRTPASLPGVAHYLLFRAENDSGPAATCVHCGACVAVCPTQANREFEGSDPRWITTEHHRCIGCGACVEVCPANHLNGGQTLRVMEAPTREWFLAVEEFERQGSP